MHLRQSTKVKIVSVKAFGRLAFGALDLHLLQLRCNGADYADGYAVLKIEDVL
jgi:hypothetical protein